MTALENYLQELQKPKDWFEENREKTYKKCGLRLNPYNEYILSTLKDKRNFPSKPLYDVSDRLIRFWERTMKREFEWCRKSKYHDTDTKRIACMKSTISQASFNFHRSMEDCALDVNTCECYKRLKAFNFDGFANKILAKYLREI